MCAKALTWRLGILLAMLASKDREITEAAVIAAARRIRKKIPQRCMFRFQTPTLTLFGQLVNGISDYVEPFDTDAFFDSITCGNRMESKKGMPM